MNKNAEFITLNKEEQDEYLKIQLKIIMQKQYNESKSDRLSWWNITVMH